MNSSSQRSSRYWESSSWKDSWVVFQEMGVWFIEASCLRCFEMKSWSVSIRRDLRWPSSERTWIIWSGGREFPQRSMCSKVWKSVRDLGRFVKFRFDISSYFKFLHTQAIKERHSPIYSSGLDKSLPLTPLPFLYLQTCQPRLTLNPLNKCKFHNKI